MPSIAMAFDIIARDVNASRTFNQVGASAEAQSKRLHNLGQGFKMMGDVAIAALTALAVESVKSAAAFQTEMVKVSTQAGATMGEVRKLSQSVLDLAPKVGMGPKELAEGLYHLESAGFRGAKAMDMLKYAAEGAKIGGSGMEQTTQAMIAVMASGIKGVHGAADAMAYLNTTVGIGDMRMEALTKALASGILPSARSAGLSMADVSAALATITDNATPADEAATRLRMTFSMMGAPSAKAAKSMESIGMSSTQLASDMQKPDGLLVAMKDLRAHLEATFPTSGGHTLSVKEIAAATKDYAGSLQVAGVHGKELTGLTNQYRESLKKGTSATVLQNQALQHMFGGGKTSGAILTLYGQMGRLQSKYEELGTSSTRASKLQQAWANQQKTFKQETDQLRATLDVLQVRIGNYLIPKLESMAKWVANNTDASRKIALVIGGFTAALVAARIAVGVYNTVMAAAAVATKVWAGVQALLNYTLDANPIGLVIMSVAALAAGIVYAYKHSEVFRNNVNALWSALKTGAQDMWYNVVGPVLRYMTGAFLDMAGRIVDGAAYAFGWVPGIGPKLKAAAAHFDNFAANVNQSLGSITSRTVSVGVSFTSPAPNVNGGQGGHRLAAGGPVIGPGTKTSDSILTYLSNGEHVWTADEVQAAGGHGAVHALRKALHRASGGPILHDVLPSMTQVHATELGGIRGLAHRLGTSILGNMSGGVGSGASRWASIAGQVLAMLGRPLTELAGLLRRIAFESGGNPNAVNLTDSNARAGHPSMGLMQTIAGTFNAYAGPFRGLGITNPLANIYAGANYALHRYGSISAIDPLRRPMGYDTGGLLKPGMTGHNYGSRPERILSPRQTEAFERLVAHLDGSNRMDLSEATLQRLAVILAGVGIKTSVSAAQIDAALGRL